jgi:Zn-dependent protease
MDSLSFKIVDFGIQLAVILFAISFHESAHAWSALKFGDTTARDLGRISLNPIRHIDPIGSIVLPLVLYFTSGLIFGYAKPTPVNLERTRNPRLADVVVSVAGPCSNLLLAFLGLVVLVAIKALAPGAIGDLSDALQGHRFAGGAVAPLTYIFFRFVLVNIQLGVFNLIPIPPLDGSWVLAAVFGEGVRQFFILYGRFGFFFLILLSSTGILGRIMSPVLSVFYYVVTRALS